jgi:hypothetical protein
MSNENLFLSVEPDRMMVENVDAYHPPQKQLQAICDEVATRCKVTFNGSMGGDQDSRTVYFPFTEDLSEGKWAEVDDFLRHLNNSKVVVQLDLYEVSEAAKEVYRLFNDFIRMEDRLKGVPLTAMVAWEKLGKILED